MDSDKDRPVAGAPTSGGPADALSPPPRDPKLSRNRFMLAAMLVLVIAVVVLAVT